LSTSARIRPGVAADLPEVLRLVASLATFEKLPGPDEGALARYQADFARGRFGLLVADGAPGRLAGYAIYFYAYSTFAARPTLYLEDLFVDPAARRQGLGTAFLRRLARVALEEGCGRFEWTVLDWNEPAQALYRALGARIQREWWLCRVDGDALSTLAAG
jgi:hypothetical protein